MNNDFVTMYPYHYVENYFIQFINKIKSSYGIENPLQFNVERFRLKDVNLDELFPVCYAALFSVNKEAILNNSLDYYNNIMSVLIYDIRNFTANKKMDHGLILEKLWLVIFNYKKYNKNYVSLKVKDYELKDYELLIKNNNANFSYFNIYCQLFMTILLDNTLYNVFISRYVIYIKNSVNNNVLYKVNKIHNKNILNILKDKIKYDILIEFKNNNLKISINKNTLIDHNFNKNKQKHNILKNVVVKDMGVYNKFIDNLINK
jgi:hypothetical protein